MDQKTSDALQQFEAAYKQLQQFQQNITSYRTSAAICVIDDYLCNVIGKAQSIIGVIKD